MDFRKIEGGGTGGKNRSATKEKQLQQMMEMAAIMAKAKPAESGQTELISKMVRKVEADDKRLVPLIEAYLLGLLLGAGSGAEHDQDDRSEKGGEDV